MPAILNTSSEVTKGLDVAERIFAGYGEKFCHVLADARAQHNGKTPLAIALEYKRHAIVEMLREAGAKE